jgi:hypothetical protein
MSSIVFCILCPVRTYGLIGRSILVQLLRVRYQAGVRVFTHTDEAHFMPVPACQWNRSELRPTWTPALETWETVRLLKVPPQLKGEGDALGIESHDP